MPENSTDVIQLGPGASMPGGIRTVEMQLRNAGNLTRFGMDIIPSVESRRKILVFISALVKTFIKARRGRCACLHIHMSAQASVIRTCLFIMFAKVLRAKTIVHSHGSRIDSYINSLRRPMRNVVLRQLAKADVLVALTPGWRDWWLEQIPSANCVVIPNCVELVEEIRNDNFENTVVFIGELSERKGIGTLLEAISIVRSRTPSLSFNVILAGIGEYERYVGLARELGVEDICSFVGWQDNEAKHEILCNASVLVLPSVAESFGIVLLEAMSHCVPVVCSDAGHMHEVAENGQTGFVFPVGNSHALADCLITLLEDRSLNVQFGKRGRILVEDEFCTEIVFKQWQNLYTGLVLK